MNIFDLQATISLNAAAFTSGVEEAQTTFNNLGNTISPGAVAIGNVVGNMATKAAGDLVDFGKSVIDTGVNFDTSMSNVKAISGATAEEFDALRAKAQEMGASTKFTATEAADAFSYMAMAGWKAEDMISGVEGIMNLAAASGEDLAATSDIVTDALTAFGLSASDSGRFADVLAAASSNANTNVGMMGETFKYIAPVAGSLGYSVEDMATAIGLMANSGVKGSQAGTALRAALSRLVKPTDDVSAALKSLGLIQLADDTGEFTYDMVALNKEVVAVNKAQEAYNKTVEKYGEGSEKASAKALKLHEAQMKLDSAMLAQKTSALEYNAAIVDADGNMLSFEDTMKALRGAFSGLSEAEQANYAATIFGQEAMSGMLAIINSTEEDYTKLSDAVGGASDVMDGMGAAAAMAETQLDNLGGKMTLFQSAFDGLKQTIYGEFEAPLSQAVEKATEGITKITEGFQTGGLEGALAAIGELASGAFGDIASAVSEAAGPVTDFFGAFQSAGASVISAAADSIGQFIDAFKESSIGVIIGDIAESAGNLFDAFKSAGETVIQGVATAVSNFMELFDESLAISTIESIAAAVKKFFEPFSETLGSAIEKVSSALSSVLGFLGDFAGVLTNEIVLEVKELADNFEKWAPWVAAVAAGFVTMQIVTKVSAGFTALTTALQSGQLATQLMSVAQAALNAVMNANPIMLVVSAIAALVTGLVVAYNTNEDFRNAVDAAWAAIKQAAEVTFEALKTFFTEKVPAAFNALKDWFAGLPDTFKTIGHNIVEGIKNGFTAAWESFKSTVSNLVNGIVDGVKGFLGIGSPSKVFAEIGKYTVQGMEVGWNREFDTFEDMVGSDISSLTGTARVGFEDSAIGRSSAAGITSMLTANSGASSQPVEVNLVLDGEVAAKVLYDPLRNVAWQKGKAEAVYA